MVAFFGLLHLPGVELSDPSHLEHGAVSVDRECRSGRVQTGQCVYEDITEWNKDIPSSGRVHTTARDGNWDGQCLVVDPNTATKEHAPTSVCGKGEAGQPSCLPLERIVGCENDQEDDGKDR